MFYDVLFSPDEYLLSNVSPISSSVHQLLALVLHDTSQWYGLSTINRHGMQIMLLTAAMGLRCRRRVVDTVYDAQAN